MNIKKDKKVLVSGASIAGLSTAWWLDRIGYHVTIVELAPAPRTNGAAVDIIGETVSIARRMGLYEKLRNYQLGVDRIEYKDAQDITEGTTNIDHSGPQGEEIEIERSRFVEVLITDMSTKIDYLFNDSISALEETADGVQVSFRKARPATFDLVFGCDGAHSGTRRIWFGPESDYAHFLGAYFSISIVDKLLVPQRTMQTFSVPYRSMMLNAYNGKTDIIFTFLSDNEIPYDYRDIAGQRAIITQQFTGLGWRTTELLDEVQRSDSFYFDKFCQVKMPCWSKGRVALVGDAAYCPSPAAGQGGSLAMRGAAAVADALVQFGGDHALAFPAYEQGLRPFIEEVQAGAEHNVRTHFILRTEEEIRKRNREAKLFQDDKRK